MSGYCVFQDHDGLAAKELCIELPMISLLVLNTHGTGIDVGDLVRTVREVKTGLHVLHIGSVIPESLPPDVPTLDEEFIPDHLLTTVATLVERRLTPRVPGARHARELPPSDFPLAAV